MSFSYAVLRTVKKNLAAAVSEIHKEQKMNKKLLCAALLGGLSVVQVANAQEFDDRWYLTGSAGVNIQDNDRDTRNDAFPWHGRRQVPRVPNWSLDAELNYQNPNNATRTRICNWSQYGISFDARYHFLSRRP